ncbi:hypothetical protein FRC16_007979 [Serendipita sp. 398]|nr:hypothetical protein FRC16_007979 [Serendipita sp. 398]
MRPHTFLLLSYLLLSGIRASPLPASPASGSPAPASDDGSQRPKRTAKPPPKGPIIVSDAVRKAEEQKKLDRLGVPKSGRGSARGSKSGTPIGTPHMDTSTEPASVFGGGGTNGLQIEDTIEEKKYIDKIIVQRKDVPQIEKILKNKFIQFFAAMQGETVTDEQIDAGKLPQIDPEKYLPAELGLNDMLRAWSLTEKAGLHRKETKEEERGADGRGNLVVQPEKEGDPRIKIVFFWQGKVMKGDRVNFLYRSTKEVEEVVQEGAAEEGEEDKANTGSKVGKSNIKTGASAGKGSGSGSDSSLRAATAASSARQRPPVVKTTGAGTSTNKSGSKDKPSKVAGVKGKGKATEPKKSRKFELQAELLRKYVNEQRKLYGSDVRVIAGYVVYSYKFGVQIVPLHKVTAYWNTPEKFARCRTDGPQVEREMTEALLTGQVQKGFLQTLIDLATSDPLVAGIENLAISSSPAGRTSPLSTHGTNSPAPGAQPLPGPSSGRT